MTLFECNSVEHKNKCRSSCTIYVVLIVIVLTICIGIGTYFAYKYMNHWYLKKMMLLVLSLVLVLKKHFNELINVTSQRNKR